MNGTIIQSGSFVSTGAAQVLKIRSDIDWMQTYNWTTHNAGLAGNTALKYTWFRGMAANEGLFEGYNAVPAYLGATASGLGVGGFTLVNTSTYAPSAAIAVTAGTNATQPVYDTGNTLGMSAGAIVRVTSSAHTDINGLDFSVDTIVGNTSFRLANTLQQAPGAIAGANGFYRLIARNRAEYDKWYPSVRVIANITQAAAGVVTTLVDHGLTTGQSIRLSIPTICGMTQLNNRLVTVTVVNASTFSINVDTTGYTAFNFPTIAQIALSPYYATMTPVGVDQAYNASILTATDNTNFIGIELAAGAQSPAGVINDVIYWMAGKSFNQ